MWGSIWILQFGGPSETRAASGPYGLKRRMSRMRTDVCRHSSQGKAEALRASDRRVEPPRCRARGSDDEFIAKVDVATTCGMWPPCVRAETQARTASTRRGFVQGLDSSEKDLLVQLDEHVSFFPWHVHAWPVRPWCAIENSATSGFTALNWSVDSGQRF